MTPFNNFHMTFTSRQRLALALTLTFLVLAAGCATTKKEKAVTQNGLTVKYKPKTSESGGVDEMSLSHPINLQEKTTRNHLASLRYEELTLFGKEKPVFTPDEAESFSPLITKALSHVSKNSIVHFETETAKGKTTGDVFAGNKRLHWRIHTLSGMDFSSNTARSWNSAWRLTPKTGQAYHVSERLLWKKTWENWIEAGLNLPILPAMEKAAPSLNVDRQRKKTAPAKPPAIEPELAPVAAPEKELTREIPAKASLGKPVQSNSELEEKLEFLKRLHDKQLIDEKEYERKRKELLDKNL